MTTKPNLTARGAHYVRLHPTEGWQYFSHAFEQWRTTGGTREEVVWDGDVEVSYEDTKDEPQEPAQ